MKSRHYHFAGDLAEKKDIDIICLSLSRSDAFISSLGISLAKEFAKNNRVFYIDHPYSWKDYFNGALKKQVRWRKWALLFGKRPYSNSASFPANLTIVTPLLILPINFLPKGFLYKALSKINDWIVKKSIKDVLRNYGVKDYLFINFCDPFFLNRIPKDITPIQSVYYYMDNIGEVLYFQKHGAEMQEACMRNYDVTFCTSSELTRFAAQFAYKVHFLPNGADTALFNKVVSEKLPKPAEIRFIQTPIIGFTGSIDFRTDFELLRKIALDNPDKTLVFVGPVQTDEHIKVGLNKMKNVLFVGPKPIAEIPNYHQSFDCAIVPFVKNRITQSIYPLKINEYLAAGLPVVASNFSSDIKSFHDVAYIEDTHAGFLDAIQCAIRENCPEKVRERVTVALQNSWTARVQTFWEIVAREMHAGEAQLAGRRFNTAVGR